MSGVAEVDSAAVARAAWGRATQALSQRDLGTARQEVKRAADAWPIQPSYIWADALLAAQAGDTLATLRALKAYSALGLGRDLRADSIFWPFARLPMFADVIAAHAAHRAPLVRSHERVRLTDSTFWAEGVDHDPRTGRYYVASIRHRTIAEVSPDGRTRELWARDGSVVGAILGVRIDRARGVLWATTSGIPQMANYVAADSATSALLRIRISDGMIEERWNIPVVAGGHVLGDVAVGPRGDVFVTDSKEPVLYRLRPEADTLESIRNPLFRSLQGVAPLPDGRALYVADYSHGLLHVDLATKAVTRVGDAPNSTSLGCDGIVWHRGSIIAVQNGVAPARVMRFVLDSGGHRVTRAEVLDRNSAVADEPTSGTIVGDEFVYVANSQWEKYDPTGHHDPTKMLTSPRLLAVPLPR